MTSKEALERVKSDFELGYDDFKNEKEKQLILKCLNAIEKDLNLLEGIKSVLKDCYIVNYGIGRELSIGEKFDRELFKDLLNQLGFEIKEK